MKNEIRCVICTLLSTLLMATFLVGCSIQESDGIRHSGRLEIRPMGELKAAPEGSERGRNALRGVR